ncbi:MAG TPA: hypothetical protein VGL86_21230 [Polyangia bacterium]|jgi:hypothetical protein
MRISVEGMVILVGLLAVGCSSSGSRAQPDLAPMPGGDDLALAPDAAATDLAPTPPDLTSRDLAGAPLPPTGLSASKGTSPALVTLTWSASTGATSYRVYRAGTLLTEVATPAYDDATAATTAPGAPTALSASDGTFGDHIALTFTAPALVDGPTYSYTVTAVNSAGESAPSAPDSGYRGGSITDYKVYRDGALAATSATTAYDDAGATLGVPGAPQSLTASGNLTTGVNLAWSAAMTNAGPMHTYAVTAVNDAGESAMSGSDTGFGGAAPVTSYQVSLDGGTTFTDVGLVTSYLDTTAPNGTITPGSVTAAKGASLYSVKLTATASTAAAGASRTYFVRAASAGGGGPTATTSGNRSVGGTSFVWQRSTTDADATYANISASGASTADATAPAMGARYFRIFVSAAGATPAASAPDRGYRIGVRQDLWSAAGQVYAMALSGNTLYIGGDFRVVGPSLASFAVIDASSGVADVNRARISPSVNVVIGDGAGGQYVGTTTAGLGGVAYADGVPTDKLVHVLAGGTVDPTFAPAPNNFSITALALSGTTLYVAGDFTTIGGQTRSRFAALDAGTGSALAFNSPADGPIDAIVVSGSTVYVGGGFANVGGAARNDIAAVDATSGAATSWNPNANNGVNAIAVSGSTVYAAGSFTTIGGQTRNRIAALDASTGAATSWDPNANNPVVALAVSGATVYAGGNFTTIGGQTRQSVAALDSSGNATSWNPGSSGVVNALAVSGSTVYVGANAFSASRPCVGLTPVDAASGVPTSWKPNVCGTVLSIATFGSKLYLGGGFTTAGGVARDRIAAIDLVSGAATAWNPGADGVVESLAVSGSTVFAGGPFGNIGGQARTGVAALDAGTGAATAWNAGSNGNVLAMASSGSLLYVGGDFTAIGGQTRSNAAALDITTAAANDWDPNVAECCDSNAHQVYAVAVAGSNVWLGGQFSAVGGTGVSHQHLFLAATDATTGAAQPWSLDTDSPVRSFLVTPAAVYLGGGFSKVAGVARPQQAAADNSTGALLSWNPNPPGTAPGGIGVFALAAAGSLVYAGGGFDFIGGTGGAERSNLAATDATTGAFNVFAPEIENEILAMQLSGSTLLIGGDIVTPGPFTQYGLVALTPTF